MSAIYINDEEWLVLFNERADLLKIYAGIKRVMDFKTSIAGITYRMSDSFFTDLMYVEAVQGRKAERFTREKIRSAINRLETIGLLTRVGRNVFKLNFAKSNKSAQNNKAQTATRTTTITESEQQPKKQVSNVVVIGVNEKTNRKQETQLNTPINNNSNPPLTSNYKLTNYTSLSQIHNFLISQVDEASLLKFHNRKIMGHWLELGLTDEVLQLAVGRAVQCSKGGFFNIPYLDPIVREFINKNNSGDLDEVSERSKQQDNRHGSAGTYMQEQQEAAIKYAEKHDIDISNGCD